MNTLKNLKLVLGSIIILVVYSNIAVAQTYNLNGNASNLIIEGTSNIHDWEIKAEDQQGKLIAQLENGQLVKIDQLEFVVRAKGLKSGKSGMDRKTYKALNTDKYKNVTYKMNKVNNIDCTAATNCKVTTSGILTIAGTSKTIDLTFGATVTGDRIVLKGNKSLKMTDFKVDPPTAMFGTITTGDQVIVKFQSTFSK